MTIAEDRAQLRFTYKMFRELPLVEERALYEAFKHLAKRERL